MCGTIIVLLSCLKHVLTSNNSLTTAYLTKSVTIAEPPKRVTIAKPPKRVTIAKPPKRPFEMPIKGPPAPYTDTATLKADVHDYCADPTNKQ